jgi:ORF6N domain
MPVVQAEAADRRKRSGRTLRQINFSITWPSEMLALSNALSYVLHMAKKRASARVATIDEIERSIHVIRGQRVMLDADLAALYGVPTGVLNQQVTRNRERFPTDFAYQLTQQEFTSLISQIVISNAGRGGRRTRPWVFTEQGVAMLSSVLKSPTAVRVNIEIMRAFVRLRRLMTTPGDLVEQIRKLAETVQLHDNDIKVISRVLQQMIEKPVATRRRIGFHAEKEAD